MTRIAYLPGDGIGPEVLGVARRVLDAAGFRAEWVELAIGWREWCAGGDPLPAATLDELRTCEAALLGAVTSKPEDAAERELSPHLRNRGLRYRSPIVRLRQELDLFVNVRPARTISGNPNNLHADVDLVLFRENTEGLYAGLEARPFSPALRQAWLDVAGSGHVPPPGDDTALTARVVTRSATERFLRAAFEYARTRNRRRVTLLEKPNVLRATGGLVRDTFQRVAADYPGIEADEKNIDAACAQVVRDPRAFDVVAATNLFGDIFSDVAAEVAGGLPLAASANVGDRFAVFEPVHGSAPDIAGRGVANPFGAVLAGAMMARHLGEDSVAAGAEAAVADVVRNPRTRPADMRGNASTSIIEAALVKGLDVRVGTVAGL